MCHDRRTTRRRYYPLLESLNAPTRVSGRVTAELEMALPGKFDAKDTTPLNTSSYYKSVDADAYEIIIDTKGTLLWEDSTTYDRPLLIVTSESVTKEYLSYLESKHISWIACGSPRVHLKKICELLYKEFKIERMTVVGGGHINAAFLKEGLLDEISILIGAGIDGRANQPAIFDGLEEDHPVTVLKLSSVQTYDSGAVWIRYTIA